MKKVYVWEAIAGVVVRTYVGDSQNDQALLMNFVVVKAIIMVDADMNSASAYVSSMSTSRAIVVVDYSLNGKPMVESIVFEFD